MSRCLLLLYVGFSLILVVACDMFAGATQTGNTIADLTTEDICEEGFNEITNLKIKCENTLEACSDFVDNDLNDKEDCEDPKCAEFCDGYQLITFNEAFLSWCSDGRDNDGDGYIDCEDPDCQVFAICIPDVENTYEACTDSEDNDGDELIDCEDLDCAYLEPCVDIPILPDPTENTNLLCSDGKDNDGDGDIDCDDKSCENVLACFPNGENTLERCTDELDNDDDGLVDCDDIDCVHIDVCLILYEDSYTMCTDGEDNDGDGLVDCEDSDCIRVLACLPDGENTYDLCSDGVDNDDDDNIDCDDEGCEKMEHCAPVFENTYDYCFDGLDNDGDGDVDCDDADCQFLLDCAPDQTVVIEFPDSAEVISAIQEMIDTNLLAWTKSDGGSENLISSPYVQIGAGWGGLYLSSGRADSIRPVDFSFYFQNKMRFEVKTNCHEDSLFYRSYWEVKKDMDSLTMDDGYLVELKRLAEEDSASWDAGDNEWHNYTIDFSVATGLSYENSQSMTIPFSLWCSDKMGGVSIEVQNLRFEGESDIECIQTKVDDDIEEKVYCNFSNIKIP